MITITMTGAGYVGLGSGACLADFGHTVICVDRDAEKIEALKKGEISLYAPGLKALIRRHAAAGRLLFSASLPEALEKSEVVFIAVHAARKRRRR